LLLLLPLLLDVLLLLPLLLVVLLLRRRFCRGVRGCRWHAEEGGGH
jgi:hypothetical protein